MYMLCQDIHCLEMDIIKYISLSSAIARKLNFQKLLLKNVFELCIIVANKRYNVSFRAKAKLCCDWHTKSTSLFVLLRQPANAMADSYCPGSGIYIYIYSGIYIPTNAAVLTVKLWFPIKAVPLYYGRDVMVDDVTKTVSNPILL